jgi:hypothetical protein
VGLDAGQLRKKAIFAQLRGQIAQEFISRALFVLAQPFDRTVERPPELFRRLCVYLVRRHNTAAPA